MLAWLISGYTRRELRQSRNKSLSWLQSTISECRPGKVRGASQFRWEETGNSCGLFNQSDGVQLNVLGSDKRCRGDDIKRALGELEGSWHNSLWTRVWRGNCRQFHFMEVTSPSEAPRTIKLRSSSLHLSILKPSSQRYSRTWRARSLQV